MTQASFGSRGHFDIGDCVATSFQGVTKNNEIVTQMNRARHVQQEHNMHNVASRAKKPWFLQWFTGTVRQLPAAVTKNNHNLNAKKWTLKLYDDDDDDDGQDS